jgi:hypothetical protein
MVVNYKDQEGKLQHKSYVGISPEKSHSAPTTFAFLRKLVPQVQELLPQLSCIHYITDSPVSQYRNKSITKVIAMHSKYFPGVTCTWDFLESGHGKGPCDGVGGSIKHYADTAVKKGVLITNAQDFFTWAVENNEKMSCFYVTSGEVSVADRMLKNATPLKGLSKCHSVRPFNGYVYIRDMSCYKGCCEVSPSCPGWQQTDLEITLVQADEYDQQSVPEVANDDARDEPLVVYQIGCVVEFSYNRKVYGGQIENYNEERKDYEVKFMKKNRGGRYIVPKATWSAWVPVEDIIKVIE